MSLVKSRDINLLVVHGESGLSKRQKDIVSVIKGRTENQGGRFTVRYENFDCSKINGLTFSEVYFDEVSSLVDD